MRVLRQPNVGSILGSIAIAGVCICALTALQLPQLRQLSRPAAKLSRPEVERAVDAEEVNLQFLKQVPAFGFDNLVANWTFLNFLQYFGDNPARDLTGYRLSPNYFEVILDRDPRFLDAYFYLSSSSSLYAGMPERTIEIMSEHLPQLTPQVPKGAYYIWRYKGVDELLFLGSAPQAEKSFQTASEWGKAVGDAEALRVAQISERTANFLSHNPDSKTAQVDAWLWVLRNAFDDPTRRRVIQRIEALGGRISVSPEGQFQVTMPPED